MPLADPPRVFTDVLVLQKTDLGWLCQIDGQNIFLGRLDIERGTVVPPEGTRGPVTIATVAVSDVEQRIRRSRRAEMAQKAARARWAMKSARPNRAD